MSEMLCEGDVSDVLKKFNYLFFWLLLSVFIGDSDVYVLAYAFVDERIIIEFNLRLYFVVGWVIV